MIRTRTFARLGALAVLFLGAAGCSSSFVPVSGDVTLEGKALANTRVIFTPVDGRGRPAYGTTDDSGHFTLTCDSKSGVPKGEYKVTFAAVADTGIDQFKPDPNIDPAKRVKDFQDKARRDQETARKRGEQIHGNYTKVDTTPHTVKVPTEGALKFDLNRNGT